MKKRHSAEQMVAKLRQADVALGQGHKVRDVCSGRAKTVDCWVLLSDRKRECLLALACCGGGWPHYAQIRGKEARQTIAYTL
jgi:hypothetical protein